MKKTIFTGAGVAIITPFDDSGKINFSELGKIIDDQIANETDAIIITGTTGESAAMNDESIRIKESRSLRVRVQMILPMRFNFHSTQKKSGRTLYLLSRLTTTNALKTVWSLITIKLPTA